MATISSQIAASSPASAIPDSSTVLAMMNITDVKTEVLEQISTTVPMVITPSELAMITETMSLEGVSATPESTFSSVPAPSESKGTASETDSGFTPDPTSVYLSRSMSDGLDMTATPSLPPEIIERSNPSSTMSPGGNNIYKYIAIGAGVGLVVTVAVIITAIGVRIYYVKHRMRTYTVNKPKAV